MQTTTLPRREGFTAGDHVRAHRTGYWHHGIYLADDTVVHFAGDIRKDLATARIRCTSFEEFAEGELVEVVPYTDPVFEPDIVVGRALSVLDRGGYALVNNNCEHFARWCKTRKSESAQVQNFILLSALAGLLWWANRAPPGSDGSRSPSNDSKGRGT